MFRSLQMCRAHIGFLAIAFVLAFCVATSPAHAKNFNVKSYGAVGDGTTDDSAAVVSAITAAEVANGNTVLFPAGNYYLNSEINANNIKLLGNSATITFGPQAEFQLSGTGVECHSLTMVGSGFGLGPADSWVVDSCTFNTYQYGITVGPTGGTGKVTNCTFVNTNGANIGIYVNDATMVTIANNTFSSTGQTGNAVIANASVEVKSNTFTNMYYGIWLDGRQNVDAYTGKVSNNTFTNCFIGVGCQNFAQVTFATNVASSSIYGLQGNDNAQVVAQNNSIDSTQFPIQLLNDTGSDTITGNSLTNLQNSTQQNFAGIGILTGYGIDVESNDASVAITSNSVSATNSSSDGIHLYEVSNAKVTKNTVSGVTHGIYSDTNDIITINNNSIQNCAQNGIYSTDDSGNLTLDTNQITDVDGAGGAVAVIYVVDSTASPIVIKNNTYTQDTTTDLQYFIDETTGTATLKGNVTNTLLPNNP